MGTLVYSRASNGLVFVSKGIVDNCQQIMGMKLPIFWEAPPEDSCSSIGIYNF